MTQKHRAAIDAMNAAGERRPNPWPLRGYAPGNYMCKCILCGNEFQGDKRAMECLECAVSLTKQFDRPAIGEGSRVEGLEVLRQKAAAIKAEFETGHTEPFDCSTPNGALHYGRWQGMEMAADLLSALRSPPEPGRDAPEPVAWQWQTSGGEWLLCEDADEAKRKIWIGKHRVRPLFASPPDGELVRMRETLREFDCPRPCNDRPDDFTVGQCVDAGECGCGARAALSAKEGQKP